MVPAALEGAVRLCVPVASAVVFVFFSPLPPTASKINLPRELLKIFSFL